jgi:hypothetical protein
MRSNWNVEANMLAVITIVSLNNIAEA